MLTIPRSIDAAGTTSIPQEEQCPVSEEVLGHLYQASKHGLEELVTTVPATTRAMLALYCYRRAHLQSIGLVVAASCTVDDLETFGGNAGKALFEKARNLDNRSPRSQYLARRKISLSTGMLRRVIQDEDSSEEAS
jgi:hypothetical protein